jgi:thiol-disulfide isomerase/thioredoxin
VLKRLILIGLAIIVCWGCRRRPSEPVSNEPSAPVSKFSKLARLELQPLTGDSRAVTLADLRGSVVLLNFWGPWCSVCRQELPHIAAIYAGRKGQADFKLLAVSCGDPEREEDIDALRKDTSYLLEHKGIKMPTYVDPGGVTAAAVDAVAKFKGYPTALLLDRDGGIRQVWSGYNPGTEVEIENAITELLGKQGETGKP